MRGLLLLLVAGLVAGGDGPVRSGEKAVPVNVFGLPENAVPSKGALVICGGGDLDDEIYDEFVRLAGGRKARLILIPSAYDYGDLDRIRRAFGGWTEYTVESFGFLHTDDPEQADDARFTRALERATGVWIAGGTQGRLISRYGRTRVEELLRGVVARGGVVGGTSAGASVMSATMIRYGSYTDAVVDCGFGLVTRVVIDQHFSERGRFPRLLGVLEANPGQMGLGVDEATAVILQQNQLRVMGEGRGTVCFGPVRDGDGTTVHRLMAGEEAEVTTTPAANGEGALSFRRRYGTAKK